MLYKEMDRMKRWVMIVLAVVCTALTGCERSASEVENTQYVFSGEVIEAEEEYLRIEVNDAGNSRIKYRLYSILCYKYTPKMPGILGVFGYTDFRRLCGGLSGIYGRGIRTGTVGVRCRGSCPSAGGTVHFQGRCDRR